MFASRKIVILFIIVIYVSKAQKGVYCLGCVDESWQFLRKPINVTWARSSYKILWTLIRKYQFAHMAGDFSYLRELKIRSLYFIYLLYLKFTQTYFGSIRESNKCATWNTTCSTYNISVMLYPTENMNA